MSLRLQILIATLASRRPFFDRLHAALSPQLEDGVEMLIDEDDGEVSIGEKRQRMLERATAEYVSFFDDDDLPSADFVVRVMDAIEVESSPQPDIVGFRLRYFVNRERRGYAIHSYSAEQHPGIPLPAGCRPRRWTRFNRQPNHLNPVRRDLALQAGFRPLDKGEDSDYARRLAKIEPRLRESFIDADLYDYLYRTDRGQETTHETRLINAHRRKMVPV